MYGDGIHLTVVHKREWSYGFKPDNKTVPLPCYLTTNEKVARRKLSLLELAKELNNQSLQAHRLQPSAVLRNTP